MALSNDFAARVVMASTRRLECERCRRERLAVQTGIADHAR
jgi:hypothetical protein